MKKKTIFVTGGLGFIGSHLVELLITKSYKVVVIDFMGIGSNQKNLKKHKNLTLKILDINKTRTIKNYIKKYKPDCIFNLAAETHVDRSIINPKPFINSNFLGTYNLIETLRNLKLKKNFKFIHISTDEVFGDISINKKSTEKDPYNPSSPYASTKAAADLLIKSYIRTYKFPSIITNCTNNFGPRQFKEKLIPKIIFNILNNKNIPIYGNGNNQREWLYVKDHCKILFKLFQRGKLGETYNIGSGDVKTNLYVAKKILSLIKTKFNINSKSKIIFVKDRKGHDFRYSLNLNKLNKIYNLKKNLNFEKSMIKTIEWYIDNYNSKNK